MIFIMEIHAGKDTPKGYTCAFVMGFDVSQKRFYRAIQRGNSKYGLENISKVELEICDATERLGFCKNISLIYSMYTNDACISV